MRVDANRLIGEMTSGLSTRYAPGSDHDEVGRLLGDRAIGEATLDGRMQDGSGVLLDATPHGQACALVTASTLRLRCVAVATGPSMLIRPDACVAWAGAARGVEGLEDAPGRWFRSRLPIRPGTALAIPSSSTA